MRRNERRTGRTLWAVTVLATLVAAAPARAAEGAETVAARVAELRRVRDAMVAHLEARLAADAEKGPGADYVLRFDQGADGEAMDVVLRQRGGAWRSGHAAVPVWRQESFQDKFRYYHRGGHARVVRDKWRFAVDAEGLRAEAGRLGGSAVMDIRLDLTREERFPPGTPVRWSNTGEVFTWFERMNALSFHTPRRQRYAIDADCSETVREFSLVLEDAADGRSPVEVVFRAPQPTWDRPEVRARWWNASWHEADASGVVVTDGRVSGTLAITFKPDKWYPKKPVEMRYVLEGRIDGPRCTGTYQGEGGFGDLSGSFAGECGAHVTGRFEAEGALGRTGSRLRGRKLPVRMDVAALFGGDEPAGTPAQAVRALGTLLHQVRALDMALKQYPLPIEEALRQTATAWPRWGETGAPAEGDWPDALAHADRVVACAAAAAERAEPAPYAHGLVGPADRTFGPFFGAEPLTATGAAYTMPEVTPDGAQRWAYLPAWRILGPLPRDDDYDHNTAEIPEAFPCGGAYDIDPALFPSEKGKPAPEPIARWTLVEVDGPKVRSPWQQVRRRGTFRGHTVHAAATLEAPRAMDVWVSMAALEHGKLWVNDRLVWVSDERQWRTHAGREAVLKVALRQGVNRLLVRCREDRGEAWFRMHVCLQGSPASEAAADAALAVGPEPGADAEPPLAWDIEKGVNVAWEAELPEPATAGPAVLDGRLCYGAAAGEVTCVDAASGTRLWRRDDALLEAFDGQRRTEVAQAVADVRASRSDGDAGRRRALGHGWGRFQPVGERLYAYHTLGAVLCLDAAGQTCWAADTGLEDATMRVVGNRVLLEGVVRAEKRGAPTTRRLALDAATGKLAWQKELPGRLGGSLHALRLADDGPGARMVASTCGQVFDALDGRIALERLDIDAAPPGTKPKGIFDEEGDFAWHFVGRDLYCAKLGVIYAVRFFLDPHGQVGHRVLWRNNYGIKYDRPIPMTAWGPWALAVNIVQENCPGHSNAWRREVSVYERDTGRPVVRLKPVLDDCQSWGPSPRAGHYLFVHDPGALTDYGQVAVVELGVDRPHVLCLNRVPDGTAVPVFDGPRMFLRQGRKLWCVAATTAEGKRYQQARIGAALIDAILPPPAEGRDLAAPEPLRDPPSRAEAPRATLDDKAGPGRWLLAGPFGAPDAADHPTLAALRAARGETLALAGGARTFEPLPDAALHVGTSWGHAYYLDGLGGTTAQPFRRVDLLRCVGGDPDASAVLYTVLDNTRDREATVRIARRGLDVWLGGLKMRPNQRVRLAKGFYPLVVRIGPDCFERPLPKLDVRTALADKSMRPLDWPTQWTVFGGVPGSVDLATPDQLREIPETLTLGGRTLEPVTRTADSGGMVDLVDPGATRDDAPTSKQTAYCFGTFECDRDATLVVNCSADWWMLWYLDGKLVYSTAAKGNEAPPDRLSAHTWSAAVGKGRHVVAAVVRSGSEGWSVTSLGGLVEKSIDELRAEQVDPKTPLPPAVVTPVSFEVHPTPADILAARLRAARDRRAALEHVVAEAPESPAAEAARAWLKRLASSPHGSPATQGD